MAITTGTLKVNITEHCILNGKNRGSSNNFSISSINEIYTRIVNCPANAETTIAIFNSLVGAAGGSTVFDSSLDVNDVRYIRVTNLSSSNSLTLSLQVDVGEDDTAADESASILLNKGQSFMMGTPEDGIGVFDTDATLVTDLQDLESIVVQPGASAIEVEIFVAST